MGLPDIPLVQLAPFLRQSAMRIAILDRNMNYLAASQGWTSDHGWGHRDLTGLNHYELHPDIPDRWKEIHRKGLAGETHSRNEDLWLRADGRKAWVQWSVGPWLDGHGNIGGIVILAEDLSSQKNTETELRLIRTLVDESNDTFEVVEPETGRIIDVNEKGPSELGCTRGEYLSLRVWDLDPTIDESDWQKAVEIIRAKGSISGEGIHRRKDGTTFPVEYNAKWVSLDRNYIVAVVRDITERNRTKEKLAESEEKYRTLFANLTERVRYWKIVRDEEGQVKTWRLVDANPATLRSWGKTLDEVKGRTPDEILGPGTSDQYRAKVQKIMTEGVPLTWEDPAPLGGKYFRYAFVPVGENIITSVSDITAIRKANEALRESDERFRQVTEAIDQVFWMTDQTKNEMLYVSPGYERIWGRTCQSLYDSPYNWLEAIHPEDRIRIRDASSKKQIIGEYDVEYRIVRPDGAVRWIHDRAFPICDAEKKVYRIAGISEDITERKRLEKEVLEIREFEQRRIGQDLHDDLCQHLAAIRILSGMLESDLAAKSLPEAEAAARITAAIRESIERARGLAHDLAPIVPGIDGLSTALERLTKKVAELFHVQCEYRFDFALEARDNMAATQIYRIVQEAINNAVKHGPAKAIVLKIVAKEDDYELVIKDNGGGFLIEDDEHQGMGLRTMKYRAGLIGGSLRVDSVAAKGTRIICTFPKTLFYPVNFA